MFKLIPNERGYFDLAEIKNKKVSDKHYFYCSDPESQTFTMKEKRHDEERDIRIQIKFVDTFMLLYFNGSNDNSYINNEFGKNVVNIYKFIESEFGFNIMDILTLYSQNKGTEITVYGYYLTDKKGRSIPISIHNEWNRDFDFKLKSQIDLKTTSPLLPKFPSKFIKATTHALSDGGKNIAKMKNVTYSYNASKTSSTEYFSNILSNKSFNSETYKVEVKSENIISLSCLIESTNSISNFESITLEGIKKRFDLGVFLLQRALDCYQRNTKALKEGTQMTTQEYVSFEEEQKKKEKEASENI